MKREEELFLEVLRGAVHPGGEATPLAAGAAGALAPADWKAVLDTAAMQNLFPLIYDAAGTYPSFAAFDAQHPQYLVVATAAMTGQMQRSSAFLDLYRAFLASGLAPLVVKGMVCRTLYEKRDLRPSGDEDVLIEKQDYEKAAAVLAACGYRRDGVAPDKELAVIQEVTFSKEGLSIELHLNPFGTSSDLRDKMNGWFENAFQSRETVDVEGVPIRTMEPTDHFLFLVFHAFKHFSAAGFGVRLMLDALLFAQKYGDRIDWDAVHRGVSDVGACGFLADMVALGNAHLGFSLEQREQPVCPEGLLADMFRAGTFGNLTNVSSTAGMMINNEMQGKASLQGGKAATYVRLLFPSWKTWVDGRPYLQDKPWLVVPAWFGRIGKYLKGKTNTTDLKNLGTSYEIASARMELFKKYDLL